jgi:PAS domain S-box-containing protein
MESGALKVLDAGLYRRGRFIGEVARWVSVALAVASVLFVWNMPGTRPELAMAVLGGYGLLILARTVLARRGPARPAWDAVQEVADTLGITLAAFFTGRMESPIWLLLYPHAVAVSMRGGVRRALAFGVLDAAAAGLLAAFTPTHPVGMLHAMSLIFCAFMGGITSSHLKMVQERLSDANREMLAKNEALSRTVRALETTRSEQESALFLLRESESRYRRLLERIQDGVVIVQDGRIAYANEVFAGMVGDPPDALVGLDFLELVPPEDRAEIAARYRRWEETQAVSGVLESRLRSRAGPPLVVSIRAGSVEFQGKRSVITTVRDTTRERRMEQDVKAHAERLAALNEIANAVNVSLTIDDIVTVISQESRRLLPFDRLTVALVDDGPEVDVLRLDGGIFRSRAAFRREEVDWAFQRARAWCEGAGEPRPPRVRQLLADDGVHAVATVPLRTRDRLIGSLNFGRFRAVPFTPLELAVAEPVARQMAIALDNARLLEAVRRRGRELESLLEVGRRVTERLDVRELLPIVTRSVNRVMGTTHCLLLLRTGDVLRVVAQEGIEPEVVEAFRDLRIGDSLSGRVIREGQAVTSLDMREDDRVLFSEAVQRFDYRSFLGVPLRRGTEVIGTLEVVTKGLRRRFGPEDQALMQAFADQAAVAIENARLFEDARAHLADMVQANRQLEDLDRQRRQYLQNVSHEFRTPLTVIKGYAEFLRDSSSVDAGSVPGVMGVIVESADRVIDMVNTLIDVSRIEHDDAGRALELRPIDLVDVVRTAVEVLRPPAGKRGIALDIEVVGPCGLEADAGLLQQVVRKLVDNAVKYSPDNGRVVVRARAEEGGVTLEVEDFGIGIPPEHVPRIFEKFYMVDGTITRRAGGAGVGLYLVREIVRLHDGTVEVQSRPGRGSTFSVRLPRAPSPRDTALA